MKNRKQFALFTAAVLTAGTVSGMSAGAAEKTFSIGVTESDAQDWNVVAMANDDTVTTGACIRSKADTGSKVVGYLYRGGAVKIEEMGEEWSKVSSGSVDGYIKNEYLTFGTEAKGLAEHYGDYGVRASWDDVHVFSADNEASPIIETAKDGDVYPVVNNNGHWMEVRTGEEETAYVSSEDVELVILVDTAEDVAEAKENSVSAKKTVSGGQTKNVSAGTADAAAEEEGTVVEETPVISHEAAAPETEEAEDDDWQSESFTYEEEDASGADAETVIWEESAAEYEAAPVEYSYEESWSADETAYDTSYEESWSADEASYDTTSYDTSYEETYTDDTSYDTSYEETYTDDTSYDTSYEETYTDDTSYDTSYDETYTDETTYDTSYEETYADDTSYDTSADETYTDETYTDDTSADTSYEETTDTSSQSSSSSDLDLLAALIFCEAGNQPYDGQVAVGAVVMNRINSGSFPGSISEVIYQSGQFTPASSGALASALASGTGCYDAASAALAGTDPTGGALYFNTSHGSGIKIGDHWFY